MDAKLKRKNTNSHLFLVEVRMMFDTTAMATIERTITIAKCPPVTEVRASFDAAVPMIGWK